MSVILSFLLVLGSFFAFDLSNVWAADSVTAGDFNVLGGQENKDFKFESGVLTILSDVKLTIKNKNVSTATSNRIVIPKDVKADLIFAGVNIKTTSNSPFTLTPDSSGNGAYAHVVLADGTSNTFVSNSAHYPGIRSGKTTTLIIDDEVVNKDSRGNEIVPKLGRVPTDITLQNGTKVNKGDRLTKLDSSNPGKLNVTGYTYAAGLGGGNGEDGGNITINGGIINSTAYTNGSDLTRAGAGIGGGNYAAGGNITINGGTITAKGAYHGAGVGGGYCTSYASSPASLNPSAVGSGMGKAKSGNITVNGGLTYSNGGTHGDAFGDGCCGYTTSEKYKIIMTGGTVIPTSVSDRYDLGGSQADVFVLGGSLKAKKFLSGSGGAVAYGDMEKKTKVFMTEITLSSWGIAKVGTTLVDDLEMKINGVDYNYGVPSYTDDNGILYFWLPDTNMGAEVSVDLDVLDKTDGTILDTDTFFAKDVGNSSNIFLKQYINYEIPEGTFAVGSLKKRYDGLPLESAQLKILVANLEIEPVLPSGVKLNDASKITIASQLLKDDGNTLEDNAEIVDGINANGGKYQLIITSTQYAESSINNFKDAYWGHRAYFKYVEIVPADTETTLSVSNPNSSTDVFKPNDELTLNARVSPKSGEGLECASPKGKVQFYINGKKYGEPVNLVEQAKSNPTSYNYSTASIKWKPIDDNYCKKGTSQIIAVEYIGEDGNYNKGSKGNKELKLNSANVDVDGDGIPDINIDTDRDGKPDINVDISNNWKPDINIDTDNTGKWKPSSEGGNKDGVWKPDKNIDTNGDGKGDADYNRPVIDKNNDGVDDNWKPNKNVSTGNIEYDTCNPNINIDTNGDGKPDINIDTNGDGKPDINIDTNGDNKPDINIDTNGDGKPDVNIDTNGDGKPDINIDVDGDGIPDINIDTNKDGKPDVNIDVNGDRKPDINIDTDNTGKWSPSGEGGNKDEIWKPDKNIDTNGDGKGDLDYKRPPIDKNHDGVDDYWNPDINVSKGSVNYQTGDPRIDSVNGSGIVNTGDDNNIIQYSLLMIISLLSFGFILKNILFEKVK